ncbi:imelysin family protein [Salegentibacter salegens]|uniref:Imelysin n=1 Tax=Salegentibacter salegens TaxID=143223 RepID=A0A1M7KLV2_9FLAO|nr:imelysin family protein [Salegentibacter salegens]PRX48898.1 imelysin [Salegentibacter salegens]SHM66334.1 Imelysin [Salegentibacter salegens]
MIKISKFLLIATLMFASCSTGDDSDDGGGSNGGDNFDRGAMLANWADNIIVPSFVAFQEETQQLEDIAKAFAENPGLTELNVLRAQYKASYQEFQTIEMFQIGKAEELNYRSFLNTYPTNSDNIESKIASGSYNLELPSSFAEQGFPALDYLLYSYGTAEETLEVLKANQEYINYTVAVAERINALTAEVTSSWQGDYRDTFVNNTSSSSTGSVDRFTNDYVMYFEKILRSGKIGYPAGAFTGSPSPGNVEGLYAGEISKNLYLQALDSFEDFYYGVKINGGENGPSYFQYLEYLDNGTDSESITASIANQFSAIRSQSSELDSNLKLQVETDNSKMLAAFDELQKEVILLKVDMMQALSISVDYVDSDGD